MSEKPKVRRNTIQFRFDHVIHQRNQGWQDGAIYGEPVPGAIEQLKQLLADDHYCAYIATTRLNLDDIVTWLGVHGIPAEADDGTPKQFWREPDRILVTRQVLTAQLRVETNVHRFTGDWGALQGDIDSLYRTEAR